MPQRRFIAIALFCLALAAPLAQMLLNLVHEPALAGVTSDAKQPSFSWETASQGRFQGAFETWLNQHLGLRAYAIKTDCQINLSLFGESSIKTADLPIVMADSFGRNERG